MAPIAHQLLAFNRGLVSPTALARLDIKRMALAADVHVNWMPQVLGPMMMRPGWQYMGGIWNNAAPLHMDFVFDQDDTALLEQTSLGMRVRVNDVIVTRPACASLFYDWDGMSSSYITGTETYQSLFSDAGDVALWHQNDESGGLSQYNSGFLQLLGNGTASGIRDRKIHVLTAAEHAITIVVAQGSIIMRLGTSEGDDDLMTDRVLRVGTHSIAITPPSDFFIRLLNWTDYSALVDSVVIERGAAPMLLPTPWQYSDFINLRWTQSGDVVFVACNGVRQMRIERQDRTSTPPSRSWSIVDYAPNDGPFGPLNTGPVQLAAGALSGDTTLTSNLSFFKSDHLGALFRLASQGQQTTRRIQAQNVFTPPIKVTGVGNDRAFQLDLIGPTFTVTTTVTLQRSVATPGNWTDVATYTAVTSVSIQDNLDNQIIYYRVGVKTGNYTTLDDITATLTFSAGSISGIGRVTSFVNVSTVGISVLVPFGSLSLTPDWNESDWSPLKGYPSGIEIYDGRMAWAGKGMEWLSVTDFLDSFDDNDTTLGDAGPIRRSIGSGPVDRASWLMSLNFLLLGTAGDILVAKSSSIDTPLTPTQFSLKPIANVGAAAVRPVKADSNGIFVGRNGSRVYQLSADANLYSIVPYAPVELTELYPSIGAPGIVRIAIQQHPTRRIHLIRADGTAVLIVFDKAEQVTCLLLIQTAGVIEDVVVLPGPSATPTEDQVYYSVARTVSGGIVRNLEKWALESQAVGATDNRIADAFVVKAGPGGNVFTGLSHLEGLQVVAWADGQPVLDVHNNPRLFRVEQGQVDIRRTYNTICCVGLPFTAQWRCAKLAVGSQLQAPLTEYKNIDHVGFVLANAHPSSLKYGQDFDHLDSLPLVEDGAPIDVNTVYEAYDHATMELDGTWDTDPRICLQVSAPLPCTVMGILLRGEGHDK